MVKGLKEAMLKKLQKDMKTSSKRIMNKGLEIIFKKANENSGVEIYND